MVARKSAEHLARHPCVGLVGNRFPTYRLLCLIGGADSAPSQPSLSDQLGAGWVNMPEISDLARQNHKSMFDWEACTNVAGDLCSHLVALRDRGALAGAMPSLSKPGGDDFVRHQLLREHGPLAKIVQITLRAHITSEPLCGRKVSSNFDRNEAVPQV